MDGGSKLLDGWKDLYLPVLRLLQPRLTSGALVIADDTSYESAANYLAYVRDPGNGFVSVGSRSTTASRSVPGPAGNAGPTF